jgi:hypothetical protein
MTKDELIGLAQVGMGIHSPNSPEYKVCSALIAEYRKKDSVIYGVDWGTAGDMPCVSILKQLNNGKIELVAVEYGPQRKPLTDEEIRSIWNDGDCYEEIAFARAIEAAHGIKGEA